MRRSVRNVEELLGLAAARKDLSDKGLPGFYQGCADKDDEAGAAGSCAGHRASFNIIQRAQLADKLSATEWLIIEWEKRVQVISRTMRAVHRYHNDLLSVSLKAIAQANGLIERVTAMEREAALETVVAAVLVESGKLIEQAKQVIGHAREASLAHQACLSETEMHRNRQTEYESRNCAKTVAVS